MSFWESVVLYIIVIGMTIFFAERLERISNRNEQGILKNQTVKIKKIKRFRIKNIQIFFCFFMVILIPSILAGIRADTVGTDILIYGKKMIQEAERANSFNELLYFDLTNTEIGYQFYAFVVSRWFHGTGWWLFFTQIFIMFFLLSGLYKFRNDISISKSIAVFMFCFYHVSFNTMRQFMAASVLVLAFYYLTKKSYFKFVFWSIFATSFHSFAFLIAVIILMFWILREWYITEIRKIGIVLLMLMAAVMFDYVMVIFQGLFEGILSRYFRYLSQGSNLEVLDMLLSPSFLLIVLLFLGTSIVQRYKKACNCKEIDNVLYMICILGVICKFLQVRMDIIYRVGTYLQLFLTLYVSRAFMHRYLISKKQRGWILYSLLIVYWMCDCMLSGYSSTAILDLRI